MSSPSQSGSKEEPSESVPSSVETSDGATRSRMPSKPRGQRCVASAVAPRRRGRLASSSSHHALRSGAV
eukprot:11219071-Lingulodinium_polyedra.AAC.1